MAPLTNASQSELLDSCLTNKLHRLSLATFDDEGKFIIYKYTFFYLSNNFPFHSILEIVGKFLVRILLNYSQQKSFLSNRQS